MKHRRLLFVSSVIGGVLAGGALVAAYWSIAGSGGGNAATATLSAPTGVTASAGYGSTVSVQWTGSTSPTGGAVTGYYVERYSGSTPSAACGSSSSSLLASSPTSCSDTTVSNGTYTYKVTAVYRSWTATSAASSAMAVDALDHFSVSAPASVTAGAAFSVTVTARDVSNATVANYVGTIHFATSDAGSPVLPANYTFLSGDNGTHAFTNGVTLKTSPSQSITVNDTVDSSRTGTTNVTVNAGTATKVVFSTQPGGGTGGTAFPTQPLVTVQDVLGNTVTSSSASVTLAIGTNPGGGTLTCTTNPLSASSGVATFAGCKIDKSGNGYTLTATSAGLTTATSTTFNITVGAAAQLAFTTQPGGGTGGTAWATQPAVTIQDAGGNTATSSSANVTLAIGTNPSGGTLTCTTNPVTANSGVATFAGCKIDKSGNGYTLTATSAGLTTATSTTFNITVGAATKLAFTTQPGGGTGGTAWGTQPVVTVQDAGGNTADTSTASIALHIGADPPGGSSLTCNASTVTAISGVATFAGCNIDQNGNGFTLTATSTGLTTATSATFNIAVGPVAQLWFSTGPTSVLAGNAISPAIVVSLFDAGGNPVTGSTATITIAIGTNPSGGTLSGTTSVNASSGSATFNNLSINNTGSGYTLVASTPGVSSTTSNSFNVNLYKLVFTTQPNGGTGGTAFTTQPVVTVEDSNGTTITSSSVAVTIARTSGTGTGGAVLTCTSNTVNASSGVATFAGCSINKSGNNYTLTATATNMTSGVSSTFNVTVGAAAKVAITTQPSNVLANTSISPAVVVTVQDAGGNTVTTSSATVVFAIGTNPGGSTLTGTTSVNATTGVATFSNLSLNNAGTGYTLTATSTGLTSATSNSFNVNLYKLVFTTQPNGGTGGTAFTTQPVVTVEDSNGTTITSSSVAVTIARTSGTGTGGAVLTCTSNTVNASSGVATFAGCSINKSGNNYTLTATATNMTSGVSSTFNVTVGAAAKVAITTQPGGGAGGVVWATQPVVTVQDAGGNTVTTSSASITLAIGTNPGGGTLTCTTNPLAASSGIATFAGCKINNAGVGYTITATSAGLTSATSNSFTIT